MRLAMSSRSDVAVVLANDEFDSDVYDEEEGMVVIGCAEVDMVVIGSAVFNVLLEDDEDVELVECFENVKLDDIVLAASLDAFSLDTLSCSSSSSVMAKEKPKPCFAAS